MPKYKSADIAELAHQLTLSPRRLRLSQIAGAERLLELAEPDKDYPYDFICFHLTGYRPLKPSQKAMIAGRHLVPQLVKLIEHLSQSASLPRKALCQKIQTQEELSKRLRVSMKTISRWRQRGLSGLRIVDENKVSRLVFTERSLLRFVARNQELVLRGGAFQQLSEHERKQIIERARQLVNEQRLKLQDVARTLAEDTGRAIETIRYTLRRHDRACPQAALFEPGGLPKVPEFYAAVYRAYASGIDSKRIAREHGVSQRKVERIGAEMRAYQLLDRKIPYVYHPGFDAPDAGQRIIEAPEPTAPPTPSKKVSPPADAPAYLKSLYEVALLSPQQEHDLFRRYNFCKFHAHTLIQQLEPCRATKRQLNIIDRLLQRANEYQQRLIRANLRLVVSIANRHARNGTNVFELISDGNMSLMRAIERFDFSRGYKLSTYATWAIVKNFARTIPEERHRYTQYVTGRDELLESAPDRENAAAVHEPGDSQGLRTALVGGLKQLDDREREILTCHFGLGATDEPTTLEQLGNRFGVTKERIRQIEKRALQKLRKVLSPSLVEHLNAL